MNKGKNDRNLTIISIFITIAGIGISIVIPSILHTINNSKGIVISPKSIEYDCQFSKTIRTISLTNYNNSIVENFVLTFNWPKKENLSINVNDLDSSIRGTIYALTFEDNKTEYQLYSISSIKPKESIQLELILSSACEDNFEIGINNRSIIGDIQRVGF